MQIARRLLREFWLPAVIAVAWTAFNVNSTSSWDVKAVVNIFGPTFFLISWATGQFFRVQKQLGVDKNLTSIETRVKSLLDRLEQHTTDFLGYTTGGESWVTFTPAISRKDEIGLMLLNQSKYPVFDIYAEAIDLDEPIEPEKGKLWTRHRYVAQSLYPSKAILETYRFDMTGKDRLKINIFIQTRTKGIIQAFRVARVDNWYSIAIRTIVEGQTIEQTVPENYPGRDPANLESVFS